jgi:hypothetical protein
MQPLFQKRILDVITAQNVAFKQAFIGRGNMPYTTRLIFHGI